MKRLITLLLMIFVASLLAACGDADDTLQRRRSAGEENESKKNTNDNQNPDSNDKNSSSDEETRVKLPDVAGTDLDSAKALLISKGFLITIEEQYSDDIKAGDVIGTNPKGGTMLEENSKIILLVSKGPRYIDCKNATISWRHIDSSSPDDWGFDLAIVEDSLYIYCEATFGTDFCFKGKGFGDASITDTFDKKAAITLQDESFRDFPEKKAVKKGEQQVFYIIVPLAQLDSERPTHVACELVILLGEEEKESHINVSFNISW